MNNPEITVLMAVYNGERFLEESVNSILQQSFTDFEFLIINDGSTDNTAKILGSYPDSRMRVIENEKNIGLAGSLNRGLKLARGKLIARIDADDISPDNRLMIQHNVLKKHLDIGLVSSWVEIIDEKGELIKKWCTPLHPEDIFYILHFGNCISHSSVMFRKDLVLRINGYNNEIEALEDYELWTRLSQLTKFYQVKNFLLKWRLTKESISSVKEKKQRTNVFRVVSDRIENLIGERLEEKVISLIQNIQYNEIKNFNLLREIVSVLNKINHRILVVESDIIKKLGLRTGRLKYSMKKKVAKILFDFFRNREPKKIWKEFLGLRCWMKRLLVREIISTAFQKLKQFFKSGKKFKMFGKSSLTF